MAAGALADRDRSPIPVVESGLVPARQLQSGIVILAAVNVAEGDRADRALPACIRREAGVPAIRVVDVGIDPQEKSRPEIGLRSFLVVSARGRGRVDPEGVAEHDAQDIGSLVQQRRDVEFIEVDGLVVLRPRLPDHGVADPLSIDPQLEMAQTHDPDDGLASAAPES